LKKYSKSILRYFKVGTHLGLTINPYQDVTTGVDIVMQLTNGLQIFMTRSMAKLTHLKY
jgi:hypothetical protein